MRTFLLIAAALAVIGFHIWASRRSPRFWYLGGVVPLLWFGCLIFLGVRGMLHWPGDWRQIIFPSLILLLLWLEGHETAKKRELERMRAKDLNDKKDPGA